MEVKAFVASERQQKPARVAELVSTIVKLQVGECIECGKSMVHAYICGLTLNAIDGREFRQLKDASGKPVFVRVK